MTEQPLVTQVDLASAVDTIDSKAASWDAANLNAVRRPHAHAITEV